MIKLLILFGMFIVLGVTPILPDWRIGKSRHAKQADDDGK